MHDTREIVERRIGRMLEARIRPAIVAARLPCATHAWDAPGRNEPFENMRRARFSELPPGAPWGRPWQTTWLHVQGTVPQSWAGGRVELRVDLGFDRGRPGFQAEGLAYDPAGHVLKGISPRNDRLNIAHPAAGGEKVAFYIEAAANPRISLELPENTRFGDPRSAGSTPLHLYGGAELVLLDEEVSGLAFDIEVLNGVMLELPLSDPRRHEIRRALERALDRLDSTDPAPAARAARAEIAAALSARAVPSAHRCSAVGHAHIDTAWLWPLAESERKCARTFANVLALMDEQPDFLFACSQAQHLAWVKARHPALYERIRARVAEGRFIPVGGMWVEPDTNLPGSESLARQLLYGQRFFQEEFGITCREGWLPDCFGYSGALPQLLSLAGCRYFFSQKLSWNQTNRFPHHSFAWEGIDGTRIFAHFPPVGTYRAECTPAELAQAARGFAEHGAATRSLIPFGYGDGGGGPNREMMERARRLADLEGMPRLAIEPPADFFAAAEAEYENPPVWSGELYLELHRGTFTSQAGIKRGNRRAEHLLREAELWSAGAALSGRLAYPYDELERLWKVVLLHQFHDILPGCAIAQVNREAVAALAGAAEALEAIIVRALGACAGAGDREFAANAAPVPHGAIGALAIAALPAACGMPAMATARPGGGHVLDNGRLRVVVDGNGLVESLVDIEAGRELIPPGSVGNLLQLHPDFPADWDAWDIDAFYRNTREDLVAAERVVLEHAGPDEAVLRIERSFGHSRAVQAIRLARGERRVEFLVEIDWQEQEKLLKLAFPFDLAAPCETAEIQFGHVSRPTHQNTSWDAARFELCAHRFIHLAEAGYGVAVANDASHGHDVTRRPRAGGGVSTVLRHSLLRGPRFPDPGADRGVHRFGFALAPGATLADAVAEGCRLNLPLRRVRGAHPA
ncbi:MAG TPA: glycoside hydrolase family 38 C-terminal domain-containing protein, partial [Acetobacteraceae bacterium]|nr:glycoside hydrolase family 38 C-terminal domain-containing protein [Acetobacteraceae bacterium]